MPVLCVLICLLIALRNYCYVALRGPLGSGFRWPPLRWPGVANETPSSSIQLMLIKIARQCNEGQGWPTKPFIINAD